MPRYAVNAIVIIPTTDNVTKPDMFMLTDDDPLRSDDLDELDNRLTKLLNDNGVKVITD